MRTARRIVQVVAFLLFIYLLLGTRDPLETLLPADLFPRLSPFIGLTASVASRTIITLFAPAAVLVLLTVLLGRFFCGWICPMGTTIDVSDKLLARSRRTLTGAKGNPAEFSRIHSTKYIVLVVSIVASLLGVQVAGWFDPLSMVTRSYAIVVHPYLNYFADRVLRIMVGSRAIQPVVLGADDFLRSTVVSFTQPLFVYQWLFMIVFLGILLLGLLERRFWCRHLCPLGAMLDLLSRVPLLRRTVKDGCIECGKCIADCKMNAIRGAGKTTLRGECIECFGCKNVCPKSVSTFKFAVGAWADSENRVNMSRRQLIGSAVGGVFALPLLKLSPDKNRVRLRLIRPPAAGDESEFLAKCVRCGECMKVCLTNGLHPTLFEAGLEGIWTPQLIPRIGYCEYNCTLCGQVCPSGAIKELTLDEKHETVIGTARFNTSRCIPWAENRDCVVCEEHCPVPDKAIVLRPTTVVDRLTGEEKIVKRPYVLEDRCVGCGICEYKCPLPGEAAVRVELAHGTIRGIGRQMRRRGQGRGADAQGAGRGQGGGGRGRGPAAGRGRWPNGVREGGPANATSPDDL